MPDDLRVNKWLLIPAGELHERFSHSSGPGGQSVNTADSRVELSFDVEQSPALPEWARARALERLAGRLTGGVLTVAASEQRSQLANRQAARARLAGLLRDAVAPPPRPRIPTGPGGPRTSAACRPSAAGPRSSAPGGITTAIPSSRCRGSNLPWVRWSQRFPSAWNPAWAARRAVSSARRATAPCARAPPWPPPRVPGWGAPRRPRRGPAGLRRGSPRPAPSHCPPGRTGRLRRAPPMSVR